MDEIFKLLNPDNTVTINRPLAHALGANEAIIYAALIAKQAYYKQRELLDDDGYFYSTIADLQESTGLSRYQQEGAIKNLIDVNLIECCKKGIPARRFFRVNNDADLLRTILQKGEEIILSLGAKTSKQVCGNLTNLSAENSQTCLGKTCNHTYNLKKETKVNNPNQSIYTDGIDRIDNSERIILFNDRERYRETIHTNIEYDFISEKVEVDELVEIMLDVICSTNKTVRVNGEDVLHEVVKSRFLKLDGEHIDYVLSALKKNTTEVRNIRAYLITALYNAPTTIDSYYTARVNHDLYGKT